MGAVSIGFYVLFTLISSNLLTALIGSVGLMIAFYYALTGFACVWFYRRELTSSTRSFFMRGLIPLTGALMLAAVFVYGMTQYLKPSWLTDDQGHNITIFGYGAVAVVGIGALALGIVLMVARRVVAPAYFRGLTLPRATSADIHPTPEIAEESRG